MRYARFRGARIALGLALAIAPWFPGLACQSDDARSPGARTDADAGDSPGTDAGVRLAVTWKPCPAVSGTNTSDAECATVNVPVRWSEPNGSTLDVFVKRIRGASGSRGQLWLLAGGPGHAGDSFEPLLPLYTQFADDLDVYIPDHRGTGRSTRLGCATQESTESPSGPQLAPEEIAPCIADIQARFGATLEALRPAEAAADIRALIDATREPQQEVYVYGRSYGTYLVQRYLEIAPAQPSGVILDSTCAPPDCAFPAPIDLAHDQAGKRLLQFCANDPFCSSKLPDPAGSLAALLSALDTGHCGSQPGARDATRTLLGFMLYDVTLRALIPAVIHRMTLCRPEDVTALASLGEVIAGIEADPLNSQVLQRHIVYSELWREPSEVEQTSLVQALVIGGMTQNLSPAYGAWPRYEPGPAPAPVLPASLPLLMLQGDLDPLTPPLFATTMRARLSGPLQNYIEVPRATHGVINTSLLASRSDTTCGALLIGNFLRDAHAAIDTTCTTDARAIDFAGTPQIAA